jgi:hypothetical protein
MGNKLSNSQVPSGMNQNTTYAPGDMGPEEAARKRKESEDAAAQDQSQQIGGQVPSVWDSMQSSNGTPSQSSGSVWDAMINPQGNDPKKKK